MYFNYIQFLFDFSLYILHQIVWDLGVKFLQKNAKIDVICKDCLATSSFIFLPPPPGNNLLISTKFKNQNAEAQRKTRQSPQASISALLNHHQAFSSFQLHMSFHVYKLELQALIILSKLLFYFHQSIVILCLKNRRL